MSTAWITAEEVQHRLGVKAQTLYAYVSRGLIAHRQDESDPRRSLYSFQDVNRLMSRKARGRSHAAVAEEALDHGAPVMTSAITAIVDGRPYYRGRDAIQLAETATLEDAARLLWDTGDMDPFAGIAPHPSVALGHDGRSRAFSLLAHRAAADPSTHGRSNVVLAREAASVLTDLVDAMCGSARSGLLHERLAKTWRVDGFRADLIRRALVLVADHELNASTFAARVAASTGASLAACALAGLSTLSGPLHGGMTAQVAAFVAEARRNNDPRQAAAQRLAQGLDLPGFGHPLYPMGDPRGRSIAMSVRYADDLLDIARAGEQVTGVAPNVDFALVAMARTIGLPAESPFMLFAIGRTVGWIAHAMEQKAQGHGPIRPRAKYDGPAPMRDAPEPPEPERDGDAAPEAPAPAALAAE